MGEGEGQRGGVGRGGREWAEVERGVRAKRERVRVEGVEGRERGKGEDRGRGSILNFMILMFIIAKY